MSGGPDLIPAISLEERLEQMRVGGDPDKEIQEPNAEPMEVEKEVIPEENAGAGAVPDDIGWMDDDVLSVSAEGDNQLPDVVSEAVELELLADDPEPNPVPDLLATVRDPKPSSFVSLGEDAWGDVSEEYLTEEKEDGEIVDVPRRNELPSNSSGTGQQFYRVDGNNGYFLRNPKYLNNVEVDYGRQYPPYYQGYKPQVVKDMVKPQLAKPMKVKVYQKCKVCIRADVKDNLRHHKRDCLTRKLCRNPIDGKALCFICRQSHLAKNCPHRNRPKQ